MRDCFERFHDVKQRDACMDETRQLRNVRDAAHCFAGQIRCYENVREIHGILPAQ